ncbi:hypothetical protein BVRB_3g067480 [Beta vulgaris subsp. vulgaris]|uniref:Uncharacterized protein n=1 Tax=Beta vulgaris subsp. vulgaris TaxID=3555 RepID=A0A0J8BG01_BETVV|nr:hypothetical protein BVRB_3g067480 [Beta vulgaris subsp. vulgaris]
MLMVDLVTLGTKTLDAPGCDPLELVAPLLFPALEAPCLVCLEVLAPTLDPFGADAFEAAAGADAFEAVAGADALGAAALADALGAAALADALGAALADAFGVSVEGGKNTRLFGSARSLVMYHFGTGHIEKVRNNAIRDIHCGSLFSMFTYARTIITLKNWCRDPNEFDNCAEVQDKWCFTEQ